jgi:hypothetical protein
MVQLSTILYSRDQETNHPQRQEKMISLHELLDYEGSIRQCLSLPVKMRRRPVGSRLR